MKCLTSTMCELVGEMNRRIDIEYPESVVDDTGGFEPVEWKHFKTVWAHIEPLKGTQVLWSQTLQHRVTHKVTIRYLKGLKSDMRFIFEGRVFQIQAFRDIEESHRFMEVMAEEGKAS